MTDKLRELLIKAQGERSQNQFAMQGGFSSSAITRIMNGNYVPSPKTLRKIANIAYNGVTYEDLLEACSYIDKRSDASAESEQQEDRNKYGNILMKFDIDFIKKFMKDNGITYADLAEKSKIPLSTISKIMCGVTPIPRYTTIRAIYSALGFTDKKPKDYYDEVNLESETLVPLLGSVVAGVPIAAQQNIEEYIWISQRPASMYFGLRVHGDSMIDAGIRDKCILIVRKQEYADNGDIIVAMLNGEQIVKRFKKLGNMVFLMPENKNYDPIPVLPKDDLLILGKVVEIRTIL